MFNQDNFLIQNYIINVLAIILVSVFLIHDIWLVYIIVLCIFAYLKVKIRLDYFGSPNKWPTSSNIKAIFLSAAGYMYLTVLAGDVIPIGGTLVFLSVGNKYGLFITALILYTLTFIFKYSNDSIY